MARGKGHWYRSPAVLLVVFAMVVTTAGLVYAHWSTTSRIEANINTGNLDVGWGDVATNDDGDVANDPTMTDDQSIPVDGWDSGNGSSTDPSNPSGSERYDKNVAACWGGGGGDTINLNIDSAYPSYYCKLFSAVFNNGSVPVKAAALTLHAYRGTYDCTYHDNESDAETGDNPLQVGYDEEGPFLDVGGDGTYDSGTDTRIYGDEEGEYADNDGSGGRTPGDTPVYQHCVFNGSAMGIHPTGIEGEFVFGNDLMINITEGVLCGTQVDPGEVGVDVSGWIHIEQGADQGSSYQIVLEQEWVNWNEWDASMCTFNGTPLP
jgi:hypothetical protein